MANKEKNFASAVIYVHNAENRIEEFLKIIIDTMESNFEHSEIICVNDASDDASVEKNKEYKCGCKQYKCFCNQHELFSWLGNGYECRYGYVDWGFCV